MSVRPILNGLVAIAFTVVSAAAFAQTAPSTTTANPPGTAATRTLDRAAGTDTSGAYPAQRDGTVANPPGTAASRALDRAAGTNTSGAYPAQSDGTAANPRGTATSRAAHHVKKKIQHSN
ncbi:MAG: hypothetical protein ACRYF2_26585 [Janthinobacterium lividum]